MAATLRRQYGYSGGDHATRLAADDETNATPVDGRTFEIDDHAAGPLLQRSLVLTLKILPISHVFSLVYMVEWINLTVNMVSS